MVVSPAENLGYLFGTVEPHLQNAIRRHVSSGQTVNDIGANIGYVSLSLSKQVGPPAPSSRSSLFQKIWQGCGPTSN